MRARVVMAAAAAGGALVLTLAVYHERRPATSGEARPVVAAAGSSVDRVEAAPQGGADSLSGRSASAQDAAGGVRLAVAVSDPAKPAAAVDAGAARLPDVGRAAEMALRGGPEDVVQLVELSDRAESDGVREGVLLEMSGISNAAGRAVLLDVLNIGDQGLAGASQAALANCIDDQWAGAIAAAYDAEPDAEAQARVADVLRYVRSPSAGSNLLALSENLDEGEGGADALWCAAAEAMGNVGTTQVVASLVQRLEEADAAASGPGYQAMLGALSRVDNPESRPLLVEMVEAGLAGKLRGDLYWGAVRALRFHQEDATRALLERVAQSPDESLRAAALNSLQVMARLERPGGSAAVAGLHDGLPE